jgi:signal transduction histidine kinase
MIQVLINLMDNSMKFGKTSVPKEMTLRIQPEGNSIRISLSDTGPGIPEYALKKVFEDFYRVDNELTQITGGSGIGLALVKKLITAMGGTISVANNRGPGCTFTITLPHQLA